MRKIISILLALGLVLAFSAVAMPATAATCTATVAPASSCAGATVTYTITTTAPVTLLAVNDRLSVNFTAGTTFGATFAAADITVNGLAVASFVKTGTHLDFPIPAAVGTLLPGAAISIVVGKVINPVTAGTKTLSLDYKLNCCAETDFCVATYTILPAINTYSLTVDFSATYPGIAEDFVPPFKACGQNDSLTGPDSEAFDTTYNSTTGFWYDQFGLILASNVTGCAVPCVNATLTFDVVFPATASAGASVSLQIGSQWFTLTKTSHNGTLAANITLTTTGTDVILPSLLHFNEVGKYQICFKVVCPGALGGSCTSDPICVPGQATTIAERCFDFGVYQWKEAYKIPLYRKWNLISLPLVPLVDPPIEDMLNTYAHLDQIVSVWYYDRCEGDNGQWYVWRTPSGTQKSLATMEDGKSYWIRIAYNVTAPAGTPLDGLWVWGTVKPVPPNSPSAYPVCEGWDMIGFTEMVPMLDTTYLWNFVPGGYGAVYGWNADGPTPQTWKLVTPGLMNPGEGYWASFAADGTIYPK